jgi:tetratricopeptide (TPR) repeat protein
VPSELERADLTLAEACGLHALHIIRAALSLKPWNPGTPMPARLQQLLQLHQADPQDPFCAYGIAMEHAKQGQLGQAIEWLDKTLAIDARYCYAYYQKARLRAEQGSIVAAREALGQGMAIAKQTGDDHAYHEMAELLASLE